MAALIRFDPPLDARLLFAAPKVSSLLVLNSTRFTHYPNPIFDPLGNSGILEVKPGSPIILKVRNGVG